ncbi:FAD binding domain-containing protein [Candidatus Fermentibacteria bacterium]|nr:FAD binding domain-containing protein [Candidatus Fermentibacteria bacterium]
MTIHTVHIARSLPDALARLDEGFVPLAGGTDLLPRVKHGVLADAAFVAIGRLVELREIHRDGDSLRVGSAVTLGRLSRSSVCPQWLRRECMEVATPRVRELATLGGALLQEGRCRFLNRPLHWRRSSGPCFRTGGTRCHAGGERCWAQQRSLLGTVLLAAGASINLITPAGAETIALRALYPDDAGPCRRGGILSEILIPCLDDDAVAVETLRRRGSIDFHDLVVAGTRHEGTRDLSIAIGAALPYPRRVPLPWECSDDVVAQSAEAAIPAVQTGRFEASYVRHATAVLMRRVTARLLP